MNMEKKPKKPGLSAIQNMIVTTLIIVFFVGIIIVYYIMLYSETRDNIIKNGELNAVSSASQIDKYLSTGVDIIKLTGYTLDNMIRDKRSQQEILDYLVNQSVAASNILYGNSTGIYAYINNEYLDGVGWVPDDDYVPTKRPWYIEAMAGSGKVVVVDPYLDAQTNTIMITLAKTLCDARSVVAVDISMEQLQSITEQLATHGDSDIAIILDENYQVIAHSDKNELNKNYGSETGTLGSAIADKLRSTNDSYFSLTFGNSQYIVYAMSIENDWICLSVIDTTTVFQRLTLPLILTLVSAALIIAILLNIMSHSNRKSALAEKMKKIADQQTKYAHQDQMTGLKNRRAYAEALADLSEEIPKGCCVIMFDVNGLKAVNDNYGHEAGDELIVGAAECIRSSFEGVDTIYRIGGDEFCVIMTDTKGAASSCLKKLEQATADWKGKYINDLSISYGIGTYKDNSDIDSIFNEADQKMYEFKNNYYMNTKTDRRKNNR